jgi:hypothetical protein
MEYTEQQKQIYNDVCDKYKHNWLNTTISQTMAMEMISKALTIPVVSNSVICCPQCGNERLESTGDGWYICCDKDCDWGDKL